MSSISAICSNSRDTVVAGDTSGVVREWRLDVIKGSTHLRNIFMRHNGPLISVVVGVFDQIIRRLESRYTQSLAILQMSERLMASMAIDPYVRVWDRQTGSCVNVLSAHQHANPLMIQLLDRKLLIAYTDGGLAVHTLVYEDQRRKVRSSQSWKAHDVPVLCAQLVEGSSVVVSGQESGLVKVWNDAEFAHEICAGSRLKAVAARWNEIERIAEIYVHAIHSRISACVAL